jgi:hypothetical protein
VYTPIFVVDSREKMPYSFGNHKTITVALEEGDYGILSDSGLLLPVRVERKTFADFKQSIRTFCRGFGEPCPFADELYRLRGLSSYLLIEASASTVVNGEYNCDLAGIDFEKFFQICTDHGIHIIFGDNRQTSESLCKILLESHLFHHEMAEWSLQAAPESYPMIRIGKWGEWCQYNSEGKAIASGNTADSLHRLLQALPTAKPPQKIEVSKEILSEVETPTHFELKQFGELLAEQNK